MSDKAALSLDLLQLATFVVGPLAVLWTSATFVLTGTKELNVIRDRVVTGHIDRMPITSRYRQHLVENDWKPILTCISLIITLYAIMSAVFGAYLTIKTSWIHALLYYVMAVVYLAIVLAWWLTAKNDLAAMQAAIAGDPEITIATRQPEPEPARQVTDTTPSGALGLRA